MSKNMDERFIHFSNTVDVVDRAIEKISSIENHLCYDINYLEKVLIPELGLNNEMLDEQPQELQKYFGKGLHLWQYPPQLAGYLVWLAHNAKK